MRNPGKSSRESRRGGFTLLELIVVITIIGILSSIVVVATKGAPAKARRTAAIADMDSILRVAEMLYTTTGKYPETIQDMVNVKVENGQPAVGSLPKVPKDPWKHEYIYSIEGGQPQVKCLGRDGAEGGQGEDEDITRPETDADTGL